MPNPIADAAQASTPRSGEKYVTPQGFTAIRDGVKAGGGSVVHPTGIVRKPSWLRAKAPSGAGFQGVKALVKEHRLSTLCGKPSVPTLVSAGTRARPRSCSWVPSARAPVDSAQ